MKFIGITGGVGAGKSAILSYLAKKPNTRVMLADEIAHELMKPGTECYMQIVEQFVGDDIFCGESVAETTFLQELDSKAKPWSGQHNTDIGGSFEQQEENRTIPKEEREFDRGKLAQVIFSNPQKREQMNAIVHPAVKEYVQNQYEKEIQLGQIKLLVLEAALLIEEKYDEICDELWYIYTSEENRRKRLMESRGYSREKIENIFKSQLKEQEFRKFTQVTIDNNGDLRETYKQIENALRREADEQCIWS